MKFDWLFQLISKLNGLVKSITSSIRRRLESITYCKYRVPEFSPDSNSRLAINAKDTHFRFFTSLPDLYCKKELSTD